MRFFTQERIPRNRELFRRLEPLGGTSARALQKKSDEATPAEIMNRRYVLQLFSRVHPVRVKVSPSNASPEQNDPFSSVFPALRLPPGNTGMLHMAPRHRQVALEAGSEVSVFVPRMRKPLSAYIGCHHYHHPCNVL